MGVKGSPINVGGWLESWHRPKSPTVMKLHLNGSNEAPGIVCNYVPNIYQ